MVDGKSRPARRASGLDSRQVKLHAPACDDDASKLGELLKVKGTGGENWLLIFSLTIIVRNFLQFGSMDVGHADPMSGALAPFVAV